jgi:hypothetical protein
MLQINAHKNTALIHYTTGEIKTRNNAIIYFRSTLRQYEKLYREPYRVQPIILFVRNRFKIVGKTAVKTNNHL